MNEPQLTPATSLGSEATTARAFVARSWLRTRTGVGHSRIETLCFEDPPCRGDEAHWIYRRSKSSCLHDVKVCVGGCQLRCRPRHLSMVQNYEITQPHHETQQNIFTLLRIIRCPLIPFDAIRNRVECPQVSLLLTLDWKPKSLRHQWCDDRWTWKTEWSDIVFTDESRFCLQYHDGQFEFGTSCQSKTCGPRFYRLSPDTPPAANQNNFSICGSHVDYCIRGYIQSLLDSMPKRVAVILDNNRSYTNY
ncbi:hypothetical protein TNCV_4392841 [Trichonephila clavipes]|nr:hypothetical protein TNCV_4392841 [Trichonephila clavipes]